MSAPFATSAPSRSPSLARPPRAVLCAVEPALASFEAARQASTLAAGGRLDLVAAGVPGGRSAETHVAAARFIATREGAEPGIVHLAGGDPVAALLDAAAAYDLLVVGDRRDDGQPSPLAVIAARAAPCSVLLARRLPHGRRLGDAVEVLGSARAVGATLLVVRDCDPGLAARVARDAGCSVLVARRSVDADRPGAESVVSRSRSRAARGWRHEVADIASCP